MQVRCPACGKQYAVADAHLGRRTRCRQCGGDFVLAAAEAQRSAPPEPDRASKPPAEPLPALTFGVPPPLSQERVAAVQAFRSAVWGKLAIAAIAPLLVGVLVACANRQEGLQIMVLIVALILVFVGFPLFALVTAWQIKQSKVTREEIGLYTQYYASRGITSPWQFDFDVWIVGGLTALVPWTVVWVLCRIEVMPDLLLAGLFFVPVPFAAYFSKGALPYQVLRSPFAGRAAVFLMYLGLLVMAGVGPLIGVGGLMSAGAAGSVADQVREAGPGLSRKPIVAAEVLAIGLGIAVASFALSIFILVKLRRLPRRLVIELARGRVLWHGNQAYPLGQAVSAERTGQLATLAAQLPSPSKEYVSAFLVLVQSYQSAEKPPERPP